MTLFFCSTECRQQARRPATRQHGDGSHSWWGLGTPPCRPRHHRPGRPAACTTLILLFSLYLFSVTRHSSLLANLYIFLYQAFCSDNHYLTIRYTAPKIIHSIRVLLYILCVVLTYCIHLDGAGQSLVSGVVIHEDTPNTPSLSSW